MSWELIVAIAAGAWIVGLGLLVAVLRAASRADSTLEAEAHLVSEERAAEAKPDAKPTPAERERWTIAPEGEKQADPRTGPGGVERRRTPR